MLLTGESALHIAIVYGEFEMVKQLVESGANINQRATGTFFLPNDQKKAGDSATNYEGTTTQCYICTQEAVNEGSYLD